MQPAYPLFPEEFPLHEAQLNLKLLEPLGIKRQFSLEEIRDIMDCREWNRRNKPTGSSG